MLGRGFSSPASLPKKIKQLEPVFFFCTLKVVCCRRIASSWNCNAWNCSIETVDDDDDDDDDDDGDDDDDDGDGDADDDDDDDDGDDDDDDDDDDPRDDHYTSQPTLQL